MRIDKKNRIFKVWKNKVRIKHVANLYLKNDECVTIKVGKDKEYDIVKKNWGFYSTPSLNKRLIKYGFAPVIVYNPNFKTYFMQIVEKNKKKNFLKYLKSEGMKIVKWLNKKELLKL